MSNDCRFVLKFELLFIKKKREINRLTNKSVPFLPFTVAVKSRFKHFQTKGDKMRPTL